MRARWFLTVVALLGCQKQEAAPPLKALAPAPLLPLSPALPLDAGREAAYRVEPAPVWGDPVPPGAVRLPLSGSVVQLAAGRFDCDTPEGRAGVLGAVGRAPALLVPDGATYLAQVAPLLAALDDGAVESWLLHPGSKVAFHLTLRDAAAFDGWLHIPKPGALRIIERQDGLELVSNVGKLPGGDANGPTVPRRGGQLDVALAREGLARLKHRFPEAEALCVVPSFATELRETAALLSAAWAAQDRPLFGSLCLVYPRPPGWRAPPPPR
ncbi:MAG: hypothetical protein ACLQDQ_08785 [Myxococcaceae bacterium]